MSDGVWRTLAEIKEAVGGSEAGISARLRDARRPAVGGFIVERRRRGAPAAGLWELLQRKATIAPLASCSSTPALWNRTATSAAEAV
jgi:hypothetical protein